MFVEAKKTADALRLTINRSEKRNALNSRAIQELHEHLRAFCGDMDIKFLLLTGAGDKAFASGGDLSELSSLRTRAAAMTMVADYSTVFDALRRFPVPTIAALNGDALGGGAELAMACDIRIADSHARIGFVQGTLSISTAWGGGIDLLRKVGTSKALRLLGAADLLTADEALRIGLIDAAPDARGRFEDFIERYCAPFTARTPLVMRAFKALALAHDRSTDRAAISEVERTHFANTWVHEDHWKALDTTRWRADHR